MTSSRPLVYVVSGWRDHTWETFIRHTLAQEARGLPYGHTVFFRVGCANGADRITRRWLRYQQDMQPQWFAGWQLYTADWATHGRRAGPLRNLSMIKGELDPWGVADKLIGFPQPRGACRERLRNLGVCQGGLRQWGGGPFPFYRQESL